MLWYGVMFLYILMTLMSFAIDGQENFASTKLVNDISSQAAEMRIDDMAGFRQGRQGQATLAGRVQVRGEYIGYSYIAASEGADGQAVVVMRGLRRGLSGSNAAAHPAGTQVYSERTSVLNNAIGFNLVEADSLWGKVTLPVQGAFLFANVVGKVMLWDYQYLDGHGFWLKLILLYPLSFLMVFALIKLFSDAMGLLGVRR